MHIMTMGLRYPSGDPLVAPVAEQQFAAGLLERLTDRAGELQVVTRASAGATTFGKEIGRAPAIDLGDPLRAGWTFLVAADDPDRDAIVSTLEPLALRRGMTDPQAPLQFGGEPLGEWFEWLLTHFTALDSGRVPHYVLIVGGPERVPFHFQALLQSVASVGRLAFDGLDDLRAYIEKVIRLEDAAAPAVDAEVVVFAPDGGPADATSFSRRYMAEPLANHAAEKGDYRVERLIAEKATKAALQEVVAARRPALVYTASHGVGAAGQPLEVKRAINGAVCCQDDGGAFEDSLFAAADVPRDSPCLEGAVVFQFACYGYGTPAESDYGHWLGNPELNAEADFVAALPLRLLAHPEGPIAYVGHVDTAWLHGFDDPEAPHLLERWHPRMAPFVRAVDSITETQPVGRALATMSERYDVLNAILTTVADHARRGKQPSAGFEERLASTFITRSDAQNYHVLGDPAVRLRVPSPDP
jgi:hypothetical protein